MSTFTTKNRQQEFTPRCLSLADVMPPKPLQKFRPCAGTKVNRDFNGARAVYNILCATSDHACVRSITPCKAKCSRPQVR